MNRTINSPAANNMAAQGRNGDTEVAHVTPGETIVPHSIQTPEVMSVLSEEFQRQGVPMSRYVVQGRRTKRGPNSINPETGQPEFFLKKLAKAATGAAIGYATGGPAGAVMGGVNGLMSEDAAGNPVPAGSPTAVGGAGSPTASIRQTKDLGKTISPDYKTQVFIPQAETPVNMPSDSPPLGQEQKESGLQQVQENGMDKALQILMGSGMGGGALNSTNPMTGASEYFDYYGNQNGGAPNSVNPSTGKKEFADTRGDYSNTGVYYEPVHPSEKAARAAGYQGAFGAGGADDYLANNPNANNKYRVQMGYAPQQREGASYVSPVNTAQYKDEDYYGEGRNDTERSIRALGYAGGFGRGQADQWLHSKYGSGLTPDLMNKGQAILKPKPRPTYESQENFTQSNPNWNNQGQQPEWLTSIMDKFNDLLGRFDAPETNDNETASAATTPAVTRVSSLSPTRSPRFKSRRYAGGSMARNF